MARRWRTVGGLFVLTVMPYVLIRSAFADLTGDDPVVWVNPNVARAGLGFAGLAIALALVTLWSAFSRTPIPRAAIIVVMAALPACLLVAAPSAGRSYAERHDYVRCAALDRFEPGNVSKNDAVLQAYVRRGAACAP